MWQLHAVTAHSSLTVIFELVVVGLTSVILIVLGTVNLQLRGLFVPISLRSLLGIVAAYVLGTVWSSYSYFSTWFFGIYKTTHRIFPSILSVDLEKEQKTLNILNDYIIIIQSPLTPVKCYRPPLSIVLQALYQI